MLLAAVCATSGMALASSTGSADTGPHCPTPVVRTVLPSPGVDGWAENLTVDHDGNLWVSRELTNSVQRFDRAGRLTGSVEVTAPGAVRTGPDGALYVTSGDTPLNMAPGPRRGTILRIDPQAARPTGTVVARGLGMPNGLAFDALGNAYVADGRIGAVRLRHDWTVDPRWSAAAPKSQAPTALVNGSDVNGAVVVGHTLYLTLTTSLTGRVLAVPLEDPEHARVAADLTAPVPGTLDDLAALDDHTLAVTSIDGRVRLVDLRTGRSCAIGVGTPTTAVAVDPEHPGRLLISTEVGQIRSVQLGQR